MTPSVGLALCSHSQYMIPRLLSGSLGLPQARAKYLRYSGAKICPFKTPGTQPCLQSPARSFSNEAS